MPADAELVLDFAAAYESAVAADRPAGLGEICKDRPDLIPAVEELLRDAGQLNAARAVVPPPPPEADELMPAALGRYELQHELGQGTFGVAFRGRDTHLNRDVAVKLLRQKWAGNEAVAGRFLDEARVTAQLQHPTIPAVHELGEHPDGRPWMAMKLIRGRTLAELLRDTDAALNRLAVFESVCQGLSYAHSKGVIHRDLKPENVMVGAFGEVQVMDWGLAKVLGTGPAAVGTGEETAGTAILSDRESDGTRAGLAVGTPAYMAPEQAIGAVEKVDRRSDVFGLGGVLCRLLTGRPPFVGGDAESTRQLAAMGKVQDAFARLDACGADPEWVALCKRCLAPEKDDRPADAGEVATAVAALRTAADERARQAEVDKAKAEVQAVEERKRRELEARLTADKLTAEREQAARLLAAERRRRRAQRALFAVLGGLLVGGLLVARNRLAEAEGQLRAQADRWTATVTAAEPLALAEALVRYDEVRPFARPMLQAAAEQPLATTAGFNARVALLGDEPARQAELLALLSAPDRPADSPRRADELDRLAARRAVAAAVLMRAGRDDEAVWAVFDHAADTTARSHLIEQVKRWGTDPRRLIDRFRREAGVSRRRALVLALGEFEWDELPAADRGPILAALDAAYRTDPDPGLHAAAGWVLREWGAGDAVDRADAAVRSGPGDKDWFTNVAGQSFAILPGGEVVIGSDDRVEAHSESDERPAHRRRVGRFAIAAREVTVSEMRSACPCNWYGQLDDPPDTAAGFVTWYQAAAYCNYLSLLDGLDGSQWCYEPNAAGEYGPGMTVKAAYLTLTGYRLPTETEWEYACRAGSPCSRYFGWSDALLPRYARFRDNGADRRGRDGRLRPNDFGLFDTLGNTLEWVADAGEESMAGQRPKARPYRAAADAVPDPELAVGNRARVVENTGIQLMRGGGWSDDPAKNVRVARRVDTVKHWEIYSSYGFRPARTVPPR